MFGVFLSKRQKINGVSNEKTQTYVKTLIAVTTTKLHMHFFNCTSGILVTFREILFISFRYRLADSKADDFFGMEEKYNRPSPSFSGIFCLKVKNLPWNH